MKATWRKMLALVLVLCCVVSCITPVSATEETTTTTSESTYEFPDFGEPIYIGDPLTGGITLTEYVEKINHEGKEYLLAPAKGSNLYVFKLTDYLNAGGTEGDWIHDKEDTGINIPRCIQLNSKGEAYIVGDANYVYKYDFYKGVGEKIMLPTTRGSCHGIAIDDDDNVYITSFANSEKEPAPVFKVTPNNEVSVFYTTTELIDLSAGCTYADGYLYIHGKDRVKSTTSEIHKIDVKTGQKVDEFRMEKTTRIYYLSVIDGVLFAGSSQTIGDGMYAIDLKTSQRIDIGVDRYIMGVVTEPKDGKSYMYINGVGTYEYDLATRKAKIVPGLAIGINLRIRDPYLTVTSGEITGECMITMAVSHGMPKLMSLEDKGFVDLESLIESATSPATIKSTVAAPLGYDAAIYVGAYLSPRVASYNPNLPAENAADPEKVMLNSAEFSNGHAQTDIMVEYKGKIYCGVYSGAYLMEYDPATDEITELIHGLKDDYDQVRIHGMAVGDDKVFFSTIPDAHILGGCIGWYDLKTGEYYVERNVVPNQCVMSLAYDEENNILYGSSRVGGGSNATAIETEALLMVYDVDQKKVLGNFSVRSSENKNSDMVFDLNNGDVIPPYIAGVGRDPDTGKLWGLVGWTLFSFEYDRKTNSLHVHEEWAPESRAKSVYATGGGHQWLPRMFRFDGKGNLYLSIDSLYLRRFNLDNPKDNVVVAHTGSRYYCLGNDGNLYYSHDIELWMVPMNRISIVESLIKTIDLSDRATVKEARAAYNALTDEERAQMNQDVAAELVSKEGAAKIFQDIAVEKAMDAIDDIGAITAGSGVAIQTARKTYEAVDAECKESVRNYQDLVDAEEIYARICAVAGQGRTVSVNLDFRTSANPNIGNNTIEFVGYDHVAAGNWEYASSSSASSFKFGGGKWIQMQFGSTMKGWLALRVKIPQAGVYQISLDHGNYNGCLGAVYMFPNDTLNDILAAEIDKRITSTEHCVGTVDYTKEENSVVGAWACPEAGEYLMVLSGHDVKDGSYGRIFGATFTLNLPVIDEVVEQVKEKIDSIGNVTLKSGDKIAAARGAYNALTKTQKELIYAPSLEAAEAAYAQIKEADDIVQAENNAAVAAVKVRIDAIGKVTAGSGNAIKAARQAYDALTKEQKKLVTNLDVLEAAEAEYELLVGGAKEEDNGTLVIVLIVVGIVVVAAGGVLAVILIRRKKNKQAPAEQQEETKTPDEILND